MSLLIKVFFSFLGENSLQFNCLIIEIIFDKIYQGLIEGAIYKFGKGDRSVTVELVIEEGTGH